MNPFDVPENCGCGGKKVDDAEIERVIREAEEERKGIPVVIPVRKAEPIPVENWPVRKKEPVPVER